MAVNRTLFHLSSEAVGAISTQFTKKATILVVEVAVKRQNNRSDDNNVNRTPVKIQQRMTEEQQRVSERMTHHQMEQ